MIGKALLNVASIEHELGEEGERIERAVFDSTVRNYYLKRPDEAEDSLRTLRQSNYLDPRDAVMHTIPAEYCVDHDVTEETIKVLLQKGLHLSTISGIQEQKEALIDYYHMVFKKALSELSVDDKNNPEVVESLRRAFLNFPTIPYVFLPVAAPPRVTEHGGAMGTSYALATSIPQNIDDMLCKTYISHCVSYMIGEMEARCGVKEITFATDIYYDFWVAGNATLYFFLQLV